MRLAKEVGADDEVYASAIQAPKYVQVRAAKYFENKKFYQKAVVLYMKGKSLKKALDLAMKHKLDEYISQITSLIDKEKTDTGSMGKIGDQLMDMGQHSKALSMFIGSGQIDKAVTLLQEQNIELDDDLVKKLIPEKGSDEEKRKSIIKIVAKRLKQQKKTQMAANLYLDIGEHIKALKCLITEANIDKVIQVANMMRSPEGYNLAANFLQGCDWNIRTDLIRHIISFYTKSKNWDSLAKFFEACSMYEIDEFKNYEKALKALNEAEKYAGKSSDLSTRLSDIQKKTKILEKFIETNTSMESNPEDAMISYRELLDDPISREACRYIILTYLF